MDLVIEGRAYINGEIVDCALGIENGKIAAIKKTLKCDEKLEFPGCIILPAGIDAHVHFREPGMTHKEDFRTGTMSAAFGGVGCVIDMPNTRPFVSTLNALREKRSAVDRKAYVDYGLFVSPLLESDILKMAEEAIAFKLYTASSSENTAVNGEVLSALLQKIAVTKKTVSIHCEDEGMIEGLRDWSSSLEGHNRARPNKAEVAAIQSVHKWMGNAKVHIAHLSARESLPLIEEMKCTAEVTPHHLFLDCEQPLGAFGKVNPPLRAKADRMVLWRGLLDGKIQMVASDHAPHTISEKEEDFEAAPPGVPGTETMLPLLLAKVKHNLLPLSRMVSAACEQPAEIFHLNKGYIEVGRDADFMIVDFKAVVKIKADRLHSKCGWTPFEGFEAIFPYATIVRGNVIVKNENLEGEMGYGIYVH